MGCWNETCMVSNMPIRSGDEVVMIIMRSNRIDDNGVHPNSYWNICSVLFGKYNDYGGIEDVKKDNAYAFSKNWLSENLIPREQGENEYHDHAVTPDDITISNLNKWFHGDRCLAKDVLGNVCSVRESFVKKSVWDYLVNKDIQGYQRVINKHFIRSKIIDALNPSEKESEYNELELAGETQERKNLIKKMIMHQLIMSKLSELRHGLDLIYWDQKYFTEKNAELISEIGMFISHLDSLRKTLHCTTGSGSQAADFKELREFSEFVMNKCDDEIREWDA